MCYAFERPREYVCIAISFLDKILKTNQKRQRQDQKVGKLLTLVREQLTETKSLYHLFVMSTHMVYIHINVTNPMWLNFIVFQFVV